MKLFCETTDDYEDVEYKDMVHYAGLFRPPVRGDRTAVRKLSKLGLQYFEGSNTWGQWMETVDRDTPGTTTSDEGRMLKSWVSRAFERSHAIQSIHSQVRQ